MANHTTGAQRHNARQDKVWNEAMAKKEEIAEKMKGKDWHKLSKTMSRKDLDKGMQSEIKKHAASLPKENNKWHGNWD